MDRVKKIFGVDSNDKNTGDNDSNQVPCNDKHSSNNRSSGAENEIPPEEIKDLQDLLDSGLFGNISSLFVNPTELQKQIESQLQEIMRQMEEGGINDEFPDGMQQQQLMQDEELKGDEFKRILGQQSSKGPLISTSPSIRRSDAIGNKKNKPTDDDRVMDRIHGTVPAEADRITADGMVNKRHSASPFMPPGHPRIDIWTPPGAGGGSRGMFQGVITTTVRRPDGVRTGL